MGRCPGNRRPAEEDYSGVSERQRLSAAMPGSSAVHPYQRSLIIRNLLSRAVADERIRFLVIGGFNTVFGFLMFVVVDVTAGRALDRNDLPVVASVVTVLVSHLVASVVAFFLYRRLVFKVEGNLVVDFLRFQTVYLVPLLVNLIVLPSVVELGAPRIPAQAVIVVVMTIVSYLGHKFFSFRRSRVHEQVGETAEGPLPSDSSEGAR